jgi:peroxiredoxin
MLSACGAPAEQNASLTPDLPVAPIEGARVPHLLLSDLNGEEWTLSALRGKVVLLNFWATWWPFCRSERSALQKAQEQYEDQGFVVLSVDVGEEPGIVKAFAQERNLNIIILLDADGGVAQRFRVRTIPASFFIDRQGVIRSRHVGALGESFFTTYLKPLL